jgi:putative phosphoribosyl transferase
MTALAKIQPKPAVEGTLREERPIAIPHGDQYLTGSLALVPEPEGLVLVANDRGCGRQSATERALTAALRREGFATAIVDLLLPEEAGSPTGAAWTRLQMQELARRIGSARDWVARQPEIARLPLLLLGHGAGAGAAFLSAEARPAGLAGTLGCVGRSGALDWTAIQRNGSAPAPLLRRVLTAIQRGSPTPHLRAG